MRFLISLMLGVLVGGCSKSNEQVSRDTPKKTLSGIFEHKEEDNPANYQSLDFRTDGTLIYKWKATGRMNGSTDIRTTIDANGKGNYTIDGDKVTADIVFISSITHSSSLLTKTTTLDPERNQRVFRLDGNDLISLLVVVAGEKTNTDNDARWKKSL